MQRIFFVSHTDTHEATQEAIDKAFAKVLKGENLSLVEDSNYRIIRSVSTSGYGTKITAEFEEVRNDKGQDKSV